MRHIFLLIILALLVVPLIGFAAFGAPVAWGGRVGITCVFLFTGAGHFFKGRAMAAMVPPQIPERFHMPIIYLSGIFELAVAIAVLIPPLTKITGLLACAFLVLVLPSNIDSAFRRVPFGGHEAGPIYLLVRIPLQILLIVWIYWFAVLHGK